MHSHHKRWTRLPSISSLACYTEWIYTCVCADSRFQQTVVSVEIVAISPSHGHTNEFSTLASSSCEAMKLSWLTFTRSEAVTTVTMRFSSRPTRFPTSSSSRSLASYWMTQNEISQLKQSHAEGFWQATAEVRGNGGGARKMEVIWTRLCASELFERNNTLTNFIYCVKLW